MREKTKITWLAVLAAFLVVPAAFAQHVQSTVMTGSIQLSTDHHLANGTHERGNFAVGPLADANQATLTGAAGNTLTIDLRSELSAYADTLTLQWISADQTEFFNFILDPSNLGADLTPGTFCVADFQTVNGVAAGEMVGSAGVETVLKGGGGSAGSCGNIFGTVSLSAVKIQYDQFGQPYVGALSGSFSFVCISEATLSRANQSHLTATFALVGTVPSGPLTLAPPSATTPIITPQPKCAAVLSGGGGGGGGGSGGSGGGSGGGGTSPIAVFPGFGGFGPGALGGGGGSTSGTPGTTTPFVFIDVGFDTTDGTPTFDPSQEIDLPLFVVSGGLKDNVTLSGSSTPDGLDISFDPTSLPPNNDLAVPILIATPRKDALPQDYQITVTASSGDLSSSTSFLVSLVCDPPFISSMSTSQPQSQTITAGQTASLSVLAAGSGPFSYQWYAGTTGNTQFPVTGATSRTFTTPPLQFTQTYWVRVTNNCGTADSNPATVTVH